MALGNKLRVKLAAEMRNEKFKIIFRAVPHGNLFRFTAYASGEARRMVRHWRWVRPRLDGLKVKKTKKGMKMRRIGHKGPKQICRE